MKKIVLILIAIFGFLYNEISNFNNCKSYYTTLYNFNRLQQCHSVSKSFKLDKGIKKTPTYLITNFRSPEIVNSAKIFSHPTHLAWRLKHPLNRFTVAASIIRNFSRRRCWISIISIEYLKLHLFTRLDQLNYSNRIIIVRDGQVTTFL